MSYDLLIIWSLFLLLLILFTHRRKRLFLYELIAMAGALGFAILVGTANGTDASTSLSGIPTRGRRRSSRPRESPWPPR